MSSYFTIINTLIICSLLILSTNGSKLNERRVLLPYNNGVNTNTTLEATNDACYQWSSSRVDIASVEPLYDSKSDCSKRALISVVSRLAKRQSTVVTATDQASGSVIRCDVEIDVIDSIEIITTTREIVLEDLPERLEVKAKNEKNDTFTTIGGIQFEWTLTPVDILRYRTWSSSSYTVPPFIQYWESRDSKGSIILIEGIRTGSAKVKVRIMGDNYQNVKPSEIELHVIANLGLIPSNDVYLIRGSKLEFRAEMAKQGPRVPVSLPSPQYYLEVLNPSIAKLDEKMSQIEALREGHTSLLLRDRNVERSDGSRQPTTDIHVMRPSYLSIFVTPGENFALCEFTSYVITFTLHDEWHHKLYPTENLNLKVNFHSRYFHINESTTNETFHIVRTFNSGVCKITAKLNGAGNADLAVPLELTQDVTIYKALVLKPSLILLPWIREVKPSYTVFVSANGATNHYRWVTNNSLVATVNYIQEQSGRVTVVTHGEGEALISCQDVHNSVFSTNMRISVQPLVDIETLPAILETHIGGNVILPIAVYGYENELRVSKRLFDDCSQIPLELEIIEKTRVRYDPNNILPGIGMRSCRSLSFECVSTGNSRVWVKHTDGKQSLNTTAIIGCHSPLRTVHPQEVAVLALGASIDLAFEGGPRPWTLNPAGHYSRLTPSDISIISWKAIVDRFRNNKDLHVFRLKCEKYGETNLVLVVGNLESATLPNPATAKAQMTIVCARPSSLVIKPKLKPSCPLSAPQDSVFPVEKNQNIEIEVQARDELGRNFYNISTLSIDWNTDGIASFELLNGIKEQVNGAKGFFAITRNFQILKDIKSNTAKISAEITGYKQEFRDKFNIKSEIDLMFVDKASVESENMAIFNHPKNKVSLLISKGSGYFGVDVLGQQFINSTFKQYSKTVNIVPKSVGRAVITINDLCLTSYEKTELQLSVVEATDIRIEMIDKFQLGSIVDGYLTVVDNNGDKLHVSHHQLISLTPIISNRVLTVSNFTVFDDWTSVFQLKGEELGFSSFNFMSRSPDIKSIESQVINVQVFAPLRIIPSNVTLIIGNNFQVTCIGGPQPQRSIEFSLNDEGVARVDHNGLIVGLKLGKTKLVARVLNVDYVEYSRSEIYVNVVSLNKVKIVSQTSQLQVDSKLPLHLLGSNEYETPFAFGISSPSVKISWSVSNDNIAVIERVFESFGIVENQFNSISVRLKARSAGVVSIKVMVEVKTPVKELNGQQIVNNKLLTDSIQIHIFPNFALTSNGHNIKGRIILMSPHSQLSLLSNRVGEAETHFKLVNATNIKLSCDLETCLKAGESLEISSLFVRITEKGGVTQLSSYGIKVDKISYLMVNPIESFATSEMIDVFPIGSDLEISVTFHDNIGQKFDAIRSQIRWTVSRNDLISISRGSQNTTLRIRSLKEGRTLVQVFDEENNIFDYFTVDVGSIIEPINLNLSIGEVVCLHTKLKTGRTGFWFVENPLIGDIDKDSGVFVARSGGRTSIGWKSVNGFSTYSLIDVMPPKMFGLDTNNFIGITNIISHSIPIIILSQSDGNRPHYCSALSTDTFGLISIENPFVCEIAFENSVLQKSIWDISVHFDVNSGQWNCVFKPKLDIDLSQMALLNANVSVSVIMSVKTREYDNNYPPLIKTISVPFLPAFDVSHKQVILTLEQSEARISVHSVPSILQDLVIISSNSEIIEVSKSEITENNLKLNVNLKNADVFSNDVSNLHISISSKITKQNEKISVQIKLFRANIQQISPSISSTIRDYSIYLIPIFTLLMAFLIYWIVFRLKAVPVVPVLTPQRTTSPFMRDIHSPGHRALDYSFSPTPTSPTRVGRPLYSVPNT